MNDFAVQMEEESERGLFTNHVLTLAVAFFFVVYGIEKLAGTRDWVGVFERIGLGQWFRYTTGAIQLSGALLIVLSRTTLIGAFLLACTMVGAIIVQIVVERSYGSAIFPGLFLLAILGAAAIEFADRKKARTAGQAT